MAAKNAANWTTTRDVASGDVANEDVAWQTYVGHRLHSAKSCCQLPLLLLPVATCPAGLSDGLPHYNANRQNADRRARARHSHSHSHSPPIPSERKRRFLQQFAQLATTLYIQWKLCGNCLTHTHTWQTGHCGIWEMVCVCVPCQLG